MNLQSWNKYYLILTTSILLNCASNPKTIELASDSVVQWSNTEAKRRLIESKHNGDFFQISSFYEPQSNKLFCGPTTGVILLNAFFLGDTAIVKPVDHSTYFWKDNYFGETFVPSFSKFTQSSFLNEKTDHIKKREVFYGKPNQIGKNDAGLNLRQFSEMLSLYGLKTKMFHAERSENFEMLKQVILESLKDNQSFIVVNFDRKVLGQKGGGHISPLVAYEQSSDSFLILDVNPLASEWFWVNSQILFAAMNTKDAEEYRGFLQISK